MVNHLEMELLPEAAWLTSGVSMRPDYFRRSKGLLQIPYKKTQIGLSRLIDLREGKEQHIGAKAKRQRGQDNPDAQRLVKGPCESRRALVQLLGMSWVCRG